VWGHARGVRANDGVFAPSRDTPLPDAVTAASPLESAYFVTPARTVLERFVLLVEASNASDFNDYYRRDSFPTIPSTRATASPVSRRRSTAASSTRRCPSGSWCYRSRVTDT
jgi:hypothetical protein